MRAYIISTSGGEGDCYNEEIEAVLVGRAGLDMDSLRKQFHAEINERSLAFQKKYWKLPAKKRKTVRMPEWCSFPAWLVKNKGLKKVAFEQIYNP
jgi:hypothetical protein